jgi:hypothetical protein
MERLQKYTLTLENQVVQERYKIIGKKTLYCIVEKRPSGTFFQRVSEKEFYSLNK